MKKGSRKQTQMLPAVATGETGAAGTLVAESGDRLVLSDLAPDGTASDTGNPGNDVRGSEPRDRKDTRKARHDDRPPQRTFTLLDVLYFPPRLMMRILCPKLLDRYIIGELLGPLLFGWTLFIVLFVFSVNLLKLAQLLATGVSLDVIGEMLGLRVIMASVYCLPMAMLLSGLLAFGRLSGDSELIATQAGGIPNLRPVRNALMLGLLLSVAGLAINEYVIPPAGRRLHGLEEHVKEAIKGRVLEEMADRKAFVVQDFEGGRLARVAIAKRFEPEEDDRPASMHDVTYIQYDEGQIAFVIQSRKAEWSGEDKETPGQQRWKFYDVNLQVSNKATQHRTTIQSETEEFILNKTPKQVQSEQKDAEQMTYRELKRYIDDLKANGLEVLAPGKPQKQAKVLRELEVELERKLALPFAALVFAFIGAPLGIRRQRSTAGVGIGLSLLIIILYYIGMTALSAFGQNGQIGALEAAWGCNVIGLIAGLYFTMRASR